MSSKRLQRVSVANSGHAKGPEADELRLNASRRVRLVKRADVKHSIDASGCSRIVPSVWL
jgi:hypothetical protein